ncbi:MAG: lipid-A-disaccharide synthase N-terminal domain-containing protein [Proteobacteria bacterium]|nr:lipid-A-disaccharide synthase N-terminal domain-containing protein [Pseudomonadota bacterium]
MDSGNQNLWLGIGLAGQLLFGARFAVQWLYSEIKGKSRVPHAFWYLSVAAGTLLLAYAIHRDELPFIVGETVTLLIFLRNVQLIRKSS